jgi:hypothetical protein
LISPTKGLGLYVEKQTFQAWRNFLNRLHKPITPTVVTELVQYKKDHPKDTTFEEELQMWKADEKSSLRVQTDIGRILGTFRWNFAKLDMTIHVSSPPSKTEPISEPTLLAIYNRLSQRDKDALTLMAYGAERIYALGHVPIENVHLIDDSNVALLDIPAKVTKTDEAHPSAIPKELAERLLEEAQQNGYSCLMPDIRTRFKHITRIARQHFNVRLTSHYLRKRFETRCERIPADVVNPNHWVILMGSRPTLGHMPNIYSLLSNKEVVQEYETEILPRLALDGNEAKTTSSENQQLREENRELKQQLLKLTKLLTEKVEV